MLITTKHKQNTLKSTNQNLELCIRDNELDVVQETKYLGVHIDSALDWEENIKATSAKASKAVGFLNYAKKYLPEKLLKPFISVLWSLIFDIVVLFGDVAE